MKTAKRILRKALYAGTDPYVAILDYRNTPTQGMESSPAHRLMNRRTKTLLPTKKTLLQPRVVLQDQTGRYHLKKTKEPPPIQELQELERPPVDMKPQPATSAPPPEVTTPEFSPNQVSKDNTTPSSGSTPEPQQRPTCARRAPAHLRLCAILETETLQY